MVTTNETNIEQGLHALLKRFVALEHERRTLEMKLDSVKARLKPIAIEALELWADSGLERLRMNGLTVHLRTDRYVTKKTGILGEAVCEALRSIGRADMVSDGYNASSLKSLVREWIDNDDEVPEQLAELLNIGESQRLATRSTE